MDVVVCFCESWDSAEAHCPCEVSARARNGLCSFMISWTAARCTGQVHAGSGFIAEQAWQARGVLTTHCSLLLIELRTSIRYPCLIHVSVCVRDHYSTCALFGPFLLRVLSNDLFLQHTVAKCFASIQPVALPNFDPIQLLSHWIPSWLTKLNDSNWLRKKWELFVRGREALGCSFRNACLIPPSEELLQKSWTCQPPRNHLYLKFFCFLCCAVCFCTPDQRVVWFHMQSIFCAGH